MSRAASVLFLYFFAAIGVAAQSYTSEITASETKQVNVVAHRFSALFRQTKDIKPILQELFVTDYTTHYLEAGIEDLPLDLEFAKSLPPRELQRTYTLFSNLWYLSTFYTYSRHSSTSSWDGSDSEALPKKVWEMLESDKLLNKFFSGEGVSDADRKELFVDTRAKLKSLNSTISKAVLLLRKDALRNRAGTTKAWKETIEDFSVRFRYYQPWVSKCSDDCYGYTKGTRIFRVNAEIFQLVLIKVGTKMRIVGAWYYFD